VIRDPCVGWVGRAEGRSGETEGEIGSGIENVGGL